MSTAPTTYAIRVEGHLDDHWSAWLGGLDMTRDDDGATTVTVEVADQAQLHGVLAGLRDIGAVISELRSRDRPIPSVLEHPLRTERLTLRPARADDAETTWKYRRLESLNEWLTGSPSTGVITLGHGVAAPIIADFTLRRDDASAELGWVLDPAYTGNGYAAEAVRELLQYCFEELGARRVTAICLLANDTSWSLMERVGMRRELHAVRESLHRSGRWLDTVGYAILNEEWSPT